MDSGLSKEQRLTKQREKEKSLRIGGVSERLSQRRDMVCDFYPFSGEHCLISVLIR
jgi:hypothetical protein